MRAGLILLFALTIIACECPVLGPDSSPETNGGKGDIIIMDVLIDVNANSSNLEPEQDFVLLVTASNVSAVTASNNTLSVYLSDDTNVDSSDSNIMNMDIADIEDNGIFREEVQLTTPLTAKEYYYVVRISTETPESITSNNWSRPLRVNVVSPYNKLSIPIADTTTPSPGSRFYLSVTATNIGEGQANSAFLTLFCSTDDDVTTNDELIFTFSVPPLKPGASAEYITPVIASTNISTNYYAFCLELVLADDTTKLVWSEPISILVSEEGLSDLSVLFFTRTDSVPAGSNFSLTAIVRNSGSVIASNTTLTFYRSLDSIIDARDNRQGTLSVPFLSSGGLNYYSNQVTAPLTAGSYYYGACVAEVPGEANTANNCSIGTMMVVVRPVADDFNNLNNNQPYGIWSDGSTIWVADDGDDKLHAYNLSTRERDSDKGFNTLSAAGNNNPAGLWSDFETMWVVDATDAHIYAYNLSTKARDSSKDFNTLDDAGNDWPAGLWSDPTTLWVADYIDGRIYAYNLSTGERDSSKDFNTLDDAGNNHPRGIWSDGTTMWVVDDDDLYIYAYTLSNKGRDSSKDVEGLETVGNHHPRGLWSDGTTMWVSDRNDKTLYAYDVSIIVDAKPIYR